MSIRQLSLRALRPAAFLLSLCVVGPSMSWSQPPPPAPPPPGQVLTPDQLDNLVAPIALYPDPLLSQILVATTYPLEVVEAYQWRQRNPGLAGPALTQAAQQQNWDASVQALVLFPEVLKRLNDDVAWTTNLGNAFLAQQPDVMNAVQRMRLRAQQAGRLQSTPQQTVVTTTDAGQPVFAIEPANPDVIYVPVYDPAWIWGPALWYPYPLWPWPPPTILTGGLYFGFGGPINISLVFGIGWHGWGGWGWHPGWVNHTVTLNNVFVHQYNFNTAHIAGVHGTAVWAHDPSHRHGVPYAAPALRERYQGSVRQNVAPRAIPEPARAPSAQPTERFGNREIPRSTPPAQSRGAFGGIQNGSAAQTFSQHGYSSLGAGRSSAAPAPAPPPVRSAPSGGGRRR